MNVKSQIAVACISILIFGAISHAQTKRELTQAEATQRFEEFVIDNGYTDLPPTEDRSKLVAEPLWGGVDAETIKRRHNTLERTPSEVARGNRFSKDGWIAFFFYKKPCRDCSRNSGRVIYMDAYGENIRVEHQDIIYKGKRYKKKT